MKRLVPSARKRLFRLLHPHGYGVVERNGAFFLVNSVNWADRGIILHGVVERDQIVHFLTEMRRRQCDVFLDIGANIGIYTVFVARETECRTIVSFEPDRRSYDHLRTNLLLNGLSSSVDTRPVAVSDHDGTVSFEPGPPTHSILSKVGAESETGISVAAARLDSEVSFTGRTVALKIDIEGHELAALDGMTDLLAANRCFLQVECWEDNAPAVIEAMSARNYDLTHRIGVDHYFANF